ncbi:hypothetical protein EV363DRAFT_1308114 [Boletus edulis]|nr:hypothetical protein EV363DRAFT_1308114 [Boletus edulis]
MQILYSRVTIYLSLAWWVWSHYLHEVLPRPSNRRSWLGTMHGKFGSCLSPVKPGKSLAPRNLHTWREPMSNSIGRCCR